MVGFYGLIAIIFSETGLLIGFFLPGDSLLITAGLFAARGDLDFAMLIVTLIPAAILGNATGYYIGHRTGDALYSRPDSLLFRREHLQMTHEYYERHGGKTIILAQFISDHAGRSRPSWPGSARWANRQFALTTWWGRSVVGGMTTAGYALGNAIPNIESRIHYVVAVVSSSPCCRPASPC